MEKYIVALGFFDGVHRGHQALLTQCRQAAELHHVHPAAITFDAHPQSLFVKDPPGLLTTPRDRQLLLEQYGVEKIFPLRVNEETMHMAWDVFLKRLTEQGAVGFVCGNDFRFGWAGAGDASRLSEYCRAEGLFCRVVPEQTLDGVRISSTYIRSCLETGDMDSAVRFLGHPYLLTGPVVSGRHIGRTIGIPTANLALPPELVSPQFGVYACRARVNGERYCAVTNVGTRPTVDGHKVTVEPWILDFHGDLYGQSITLEFYSFLRPERKFSSLETLREEIQRNAEEVRNFFQSR